MTDLPSTDDLYSQALPSTDDLYKQSQDEQKRTSTPFNPFDVNNPGNTSGPLADTVYAAGRIGKILTAAGQSAANEWGAVKGFNSQSMYEAMDPEDAKQDKAIVKSGNEGWIRPLAAHVIANWAAAVGDVALAGPYRLAASGMAAIGGASDELSKDLPRPAAELLQEAPGALPALHIPEGGVSEAASHEATVDLRPWLNTPQRLQEARAKGVIGPDGERGFFGLSEITPQEKQARLEAAKEAGVHAAIEQQKPPSLDDLAQRINPEAFEQHSQLQDQLDLIKRSQQALQEEKEGDFELQDLRNQEATVLDKVNGNEEELSEKNAQELSDIRNKISDHLKANEPEEATRTKIQSLRARESAILDSVNGNEEELPEPSNETPNKSNELSDIREQLNELINNKSPEELELENSSLHILNQLNDIQPFIQEAYRHASGLLEVPPDVAVKTATERATDLGATVKINGKTASTNVKTGSSSGKPKTDTKSTSGGTPKSLSGAATPEGLKAQIESELSSQEDFLGVPPLQRKDQIKAATELVAGNQEDALKVINGEMVIPGIHPQMVLRALRAWSAAHEDVDLARQIARSQANREASVAGQTLSMRSGINDDIDPGSLIAQVELTKRKRAGGFVQADAALKSTAEQIKKSVQEAVDSFKTDWESFLTSIACDY